MFQNTDQAEANACKIPLPRSSWRELEAQNLETLSSFTSRRAALKRSVQTAKLLVNGAKLASLEKQWIRSPMAGLVSEVRVKSVTVKGVSLEVILLLLESKRTKF